MFRLDYTSQGTTPINIKVSHYCVVYIHQIRNIKIWVSPDLQHKDLRNIVYLALAAGFDAIEAKDFEPASGILIEYPPSDAGAAAAAAGKDQGWELHRMVSHE